MRVQRGPGFSGDTDLPTMFESSKHTRNGQTHPKLVGSMMRVFVHASSDVDHIGNVWVSFGVVHTHAKSWVFSRLYVGTSHVHTRQQTTWMGFFTHSVSGYSLFVVTSKSIQIDVQFTCKQHCERMYRDCHKDQDEQLFVYTARLIKSSQHQGR